MTQGELEGVLSPRTNLPSCLPPPLFVPLTVVGDLVFPLPVELVCSFVLVLGLWEQHLWGPCGARGQAGRRRPRQQRRESQGRRRTMVEEAGSCLSCPAATRNWLLPGQGPGLGLGLASVPGPAPALTSLPTWR